MIEISRVTEISNDLGEGPLWDVLTGCLYWIDSRKGQIFRLNGDEQVKQWALPEKIGSLAISSDQEAVVALSDGFHFFNFDTGQLKLISEPEAGMPETRFNDGKTDHEGNFLAGSMGIKIRDRGIAKLYRLNADLSVEVLESDVVVANGPCFSPDGSVLYFNDGRGRILAYDYDANQPLANKRVLFVGADHGTGSDGATVDSDGNLWVALTGSGEVGCISPQGQLLQRIVMPVRLPSSVMFGGPQLDELYVTSISNSGNRTSPEQYAGSLFKITGLGVTGLAEMRFGRGVGLKASLGK